MLSVYKEVLYETSLNENLVARRSQNPVKKVSRLFQKKRTKATEVPH